MQRFVFKAFKEFKYFINLNFSDLFSKSDSDFFFTSLVVSSAIWLLSVEAYVVLSSVTFIIDKLSLFFILFWRI